MNSFSHPLWPLRLFILLLLCTIKISGFAQNNFAIVSYGTTSYFPREIFFGDSSETYFVGQCNVRGSLNNERTWNGYCYTPLYILGGCSPSLANTFVVGKGGLIRKNSDCEIFGSWSDQQSGTTDTLYSIKFFDNQNGVCVGQNGKILRTTNNGRNWVNIISGTTVSLRNLISIGDSTLIACGGNGTILKSSDRGINWIPQSTGITTLLNDIDFPTKDTGYAVGRLGVMIKTTDGGLTWSNVTTGTTLNISAIDFYSAQSGVIVGDDGLIKRTTDGGLNWVSFPFSTFYDIWDVKFRDANVGYFLSTFDAYKTTDGGINWHTMGGDLEAVKYIDDTTLIAVGSDNVGKSTDGGQTWEVKRPLSPTIWYDCDFTSRDTGYIVGGSGRIMKTTDGGNNFTQQVTNPPTSGGSAFFAVHFFNKNKGIAVGSPYMISRTNNGGQTWTTAYSSTSGYGYYDIFFVNNQVGWVCGSGGTLRKTTDGGATFNNQTSGTNKFLLSIYFKNPLVGFACGESGTLVRTTNGGTTWTASTITGNSTLYNIAFQDSMHGFISGENQLLYETKDGGLTWKYINNSFTMKDMTFRNPFRGYAVGPSEIRLYYDPLKTFNAYARVCKGYSNSFKPKLAPGMTLLPNNKFIMEMDTTGDDFTDAIQLGALTDTSTNNGYWSFNLPQTLKNGIYKTRVRATGLFPVNKSLICDMTVYDDPEADIIIRNDTLFTKNDPRFNYVWRYANAIVPGANTYFLVPTLPGTYRVDVQYGCCTSAYAIITVNACAGGLLADPVLYSNFAVVCDSSAATLTAGGAASFRWYDSDTATVALSTGLTFTTPVLFARDTFYVASYNDSCESSRLPIYVQFTTPYAAPTVTGDSTCSGTSAYLFSNSMGTINWFADTVSTIPLASGPSFIVPHLLSTDTFYVSNLNYQCESKRVAVVAHAVPGPTGFVIVGDTAVTIGDSSVYYYQPDPGNSYQWFVNGGMVLNSGDSLMVQWDSTTTARVGVIETNALGCSSDTIWLAVEVDLAISLPELECQNFTIGPNPANEKLLVQRYKDFKRQTLIIRDSKGNIVKSIILSANQSKLQLDIAYLAAGTYTIEQLGASLQAKRFVVVH